MKRIELDILGRVLAGQSTLDEGIADFQARIDRYQADLDEYTARYAELDSAGQAAASLQSDIKLFQDRISFYRDCIIMLENTKIKRR